MYREKIINIETGKEIWRDYTKEEILEVEKSIEEGNKRKIENEKAQATRQSALAKLAALGLTEDEIAAL